MAIQTAVGQVTAANTNRDGTGALVTLMTAGGSGATIGALHVAAPGTVTDGMVRFFVYDGVSNNYLRVEVPVEATSPSATVPAFQQTVIPIGLTLESGWSLKASTHNAETFNITVHYTE